jgi:hypothetical protein
MQGTVIDGLLARHAELDGFLRERNEISLALDAEANFKRLLVMACGSYFEEQITAAVEQFAEMTGGTRLGAFVRNKALNRQYYTLFDWKGNNINSFLALFGEEFKETVGRLIQMNSSLKEGMKAFLELSNHRNQLAHRNLAAVPVEKTIAEIRQQYGAAWAFVQFLITQFNTAPAIEAIVGQTG